MNYKKSLIFIACLLATGCSQQTATFHTWADLPDGTKEHFDITPKDCHFVAPGLFYVISPSGYKVLHNCPPTYRIDKNGNRIATNPFTGEDIVTDPEWKYLLEPVKKPRQSQPVPNIVYLPEKIIDN